MRHFPGRGELLAVIVSVVVVVITTGGEINNTFITAGMKITDTFVTTGRVVKNTIGIVDIIDWVILLTVDVEVVVWVPRQV